MLFKPAMSGSALGLFATLLLFHAMVVVVAIQAEDVSGALQSCRRISRVQHDQLLEQFRFLVSEKFVGQDQAVDITLSALRRFRPDDMLLLHFVGASGTGKTHLASLVQRSVFPLNRCQQGGKVGDVFCSLYNFIGLAQEDRFDTFLMQDLCGVGYADFLSTEDSDKAARQQLENALEQAFSSVRSGSRAVPEIIFLDNFNGCKGSCEKLMTQVVTSRKYRLKNNREVALKNVVILVTSDLSQEGLRLFPDEDRRQALRRVLDVAAKTWGEDSLWNDLAHVVPFSPYSDLELAKILDLSVREVQAEIASRIHSILQAEKATNNIHGSVTWTGRFVLTDNEKRKLIDRLHRDIANKNCRAFEKIKSKMSAASRRPDEVEQRLVMNYRPIVTPSKGISTDVFRLVFKTAKYENWEFTQNLVFKTLPGPELVEITIDDIDNYVQDLKSEL